MASFFNEAQYLNNKVKQLAAANEKDPNGNPYTPETVKAAMAASGMSPEEHYSTFGRGEKLNPNSYFNESEYLSAKLKALQETDPTWAGKSTDDVAKAMAEAGLTPAEHYETIGAFETTKDGSLLNPSNAFDANAYFSAKLAQLIATNHPGATEMTVAQLVNIVKEAGFSPVSHYVACGAGETADGVALVQTVPVTQRVANDPNRAILHDNVPSNYNPATPGATTPEAKPGPVTKPADMGGMADKTVSPEVKAPSTPVKTPADKDYVAPPDNIKDTNDKPVVIVPGKDGDSFGVLDPSTGNVNGFNPDGSVSDEVIGKADGSGNITPPPSGGDGDGGGGGGDVDDGPLALSYTYQNDKLVITSNHDTTDSPLSFAFTSGDSATHLGITTTSGSVLESTIIVPEELTGADIAGITSLDLSGIKRDASAYGPDSQVKIDLTAGTLPAENIKAPTSLGYIKGTLGYDDFIVTSDQVKKGGQLGGQDAAAGSSTPTYGIHGGDDATGLQPYNSLTITNTLSTDWTLGHMYNISSVSSKIDIDTTKAIKLDLSNVVEVTGLPGVIFKSGTYFVIENANAANSGGQLTVKGAARVNFGPLNTDPFDLDSLTLDIKGTLAGTNTSTTSLTGSDFNIDDLKIVADDYALSPGSRVLEISPSGESYFKFVDAASLTNVNKVRVHYESLQESDDPATHITVMELGSADLLAANSPLKFLGAGISSADTKIGSFVAKIGFADNGNAPLSLDGKIYGVTGLDLGNYSGSVSVGTTVYSIVDFEGNTVKSLPLTITSSTAEAAITLSAGGGVDIIQLNATGKDTITGFEQAAGDRIDVKTTLGISGGVVDTGNDAASNSVHIMSSDLADPTSLSEVKGVLTTQYTNHATVLTGGTKAIFAIADTSDGNTYIYTFSGDSTAGIDLDNELTLIGVVDGVVLASGDFIAAP